MKLKIIFIVGFLSISLGCSSKKKDFDFVCSTFGELESRLEQDSMTSDERLIFIHVKITENLSLKSEAGIAWDAVRVVEPSQKYNFFVLLAEDAGLDGWQCPVMQRLASTL